MAQRYQPMQETCVGSLVWEDPTCCGATKPVPPCPTVTEPLLSSLCSATREATAMRSLHTTTREEEPLDSILKGRHYFADKGPSSQSYGFSSRHVWMWELDYKENWAPKNWCFWTVVLEKTLESPFDSKEIQPVHPKGDQFWIFIGRTDA